MTTELIEQVRGLYRSRKSPEYARAKEVVRILRRWGYGEMAGLFCDRLCGDGMA